MDRLDGVNIVRGGTERINDLQPLWESLHEHHVTVAPELGALARRRSPADSWLVRRDLYSWILVEPGAFVFLAESALMPVGYALAHLRGPKESWATGERIAVLETLAVLPEQRGRGIGRALARAVFGELRRLGVREFEVSAIAANVDAIRFYRRLGVLPFTNTYLGRVPPG